MAIRNTKLVDQFGRSATNLRISVIDRCNLRCNYCIQIEKLNWLKKDELLTFSEITRISRIVSRLGVDQLRITGGEPLLRLDVCELIKQLNSIPGIKRVSMTTNGILLKNYIDNLIDAGLSSINISLDTLKPDKFIQLTRRNNYKDVLRSIYDAIDSTLKVKINTVAIRGFNDSEIMDFVNFAIKNDTIIRFIEFMPFHGNNWSVDNIIPVKEIQDRISRNYTLIPKPLDHPSQTSRVFSIKGHSGRIGFIASVTESFCKWCNRLRLTADGNLRTCLNGKNEIPLRPSLRSDTSDEELSKIIIKTVQLKPKEHEDFLNPHYEPPNDGREMIRIGG